MVQVFTGEFCEIFKSNFLQTATESLLLVGKKFVGKNFFLKFQNKLFWVKCAIFLCEQFTFTLQIQQYKHCRKVGICSELTIHQSNFSYVVLMSFERISLIFLVFLSLNFKQVDETGRDEICWVRCSYFWPNVLVESVLKFSLFCKWRRSSVFIVNFERILHLLQLFS